ncbi:MAG: helicase-related protein, partial [Candidatus Nitrotoga sp.]
GEPEQSLIKKQLLEIKKLRGEVGAHSKMIAVAKAVAATISKKEKVVIFCHHIATAQELTECLASQLPQIAASNALDQSVWVKAWHQAFESDVIAQQNESLLKTFIEWLCSGMIRAQTESWLGTTPKSVSALVIALRKVPARHSRAKETIYQAAHRLFHELMDSNSGKAVLRQNRLELLPGALGMRVLGVCEPRAREELFIRNNQPDTVIKVFGSPFGPDVLVVTDKLSEGIDLHRYCRHLIHYELDPSPIRTVQRNGRIRRVNSWAAITGEKICYAYPAFGGTRDQRLVEIMKKRVATFSLLLGGIQDFDIDSTSAADEIWRSEVVNKAKNQLKAESGKLRAKKPGNEG